MSNLIVVVLVVGLSLGLSGFVRGHRTRADIRRDAMYSQRAVRGIVGIHSIMSYFLLIMLILGLLGILGILPPGVGLMLIGRGK